MLHSYGRETGDDESPPNQDRDYTGTNLLRVRWHGFRDACAVGIETFNVTLLLLLTQHANSSTPEDQGWLELNSTTVGRGVYGAYARELSFGLDRAGLYRVRVCGIAVTGLSACSLSDGLQYDVSPPVVGELCVADSDTRWCTTGGNSTLSNAVAYVSASRVETALVTWFGFSDPESRLAGFRWAVGSTPGTSDVLQWRQVGWALGASLAVLSRTPLTAYLSVVCTNGAGLESNLVLPLVVDETPPLVAADALQIRSAFGFESGALIFASSDASSQSNASSAPSEPRRNNTRCVPSGVRV